MSAFEAFEPFLFDFLVGELRWFFEFEAGVAAAFSVLFSVCAETFETGAGAAVGGVVLGVVGFEGLEAEIVFFSSDFFG